MALTTYDLLLWVLAIAELVTLVIKLCYLVFKLDGWSRV